MIATVELQPGLKMVMVDTRPRRSVARVVEERVDGGVCVCGCGAKSWRRGLSVKCYFQFRSACLDLAPNDRPTFEARMIRSGMILAPRQGQKARNKFRRSAAV